MRDRWVGGVGCFFLNKKMCVCGPPPRFCVCVRTPPSAKKCLYKESRSGLGPSSDMGPKTGGKGMPRKPDKAGASGKRRKIGDDWGGKNKKKSKVVGKAAEKAAEEAVEKAVEDDVPPPPPETTAALADLVAASPAVDENGAVIAEVVPAPPAVDENGAVIADVVPAPDPVGVPLASVDAAAIAGVGGPDPVGVPLASVDAAPIAGVGGLDPQVAVDVGSSISVVEGSLGSVDTSQAAAVSSSVEIRTRFSKKKSGPSLIVNPGPLTDGVSKSPDLGASAGPLVPPVPGSHRPRIGGKSVGGKSLSGLTTLNIRQIPSSSSDDEEEDEDEEDADANVPCSSTSTKVATSTTEKTSTTEQTKVVPMPTEKTKVAKVAPMTTKGTTQPGGSKRHGKKIAKPVLEGITKNDIGRIAKRAGVTRVGGGVYDEMRFHAQQYLDEVLTKTLYHTDHRKAQTVTTGDVLQGFKCVGGGTFYN